MDGKNPEKPDEPVAVNLCKKCGEVLFRLGPLDGAGLHWAIYQEDERFEHSGDKMFYRCGRCGAKNIYVEGPRQHGVPKLMLSHAEDP
jgi:hypothetical protein